MAATIRSEQKKVSWFRIKTQQWERSVQIFSIWETPICISIHVTWLFRRTFFSLSSFFGFLALHTMHSQCIFVCCLCVCLNVFVIFSSSLLHWFHFVYFACFTHFSSVLPLPLSFLSFSFALSLSSLSLFCLLLSHWLQLAKKKVDWTKNVNMINGYKRIRGVKQSQKQIYRAKYI